MTLLQRFKTPFADHAIDPVPRPQYRQVGEVLQERREDLGLDLDEIGAMLKIKPGYLVAIEQGRSHDLPGPTYALGFVRAYADFLGLDAERILLQYKTQTAGLSERQDLTLPMPLGERSLPGGTLVLVALIVAVCGYGTWYYLSTGDRDRPERVAAVPPSLQVVPSPLVSPSNAPSSSLASPPASAPSPGADRAAANAAVPVTPTPRLNPVATPAAVPAMRSAAPPIGPVAGAAAGQGGAPPAAAPDARSSALTVPTAPAPATTLPAAAPASADPSGARVAIRAVSDCWVQIRAPDQKIVISRVLKAGETYKVPPRAGLSLRTGNAGALEITVDGKPVPSIGGIGALRRDVVLDPAALTAGTAVRG